MMGDEEMLGCLCKDADMGRSAAGHVLGLIHNDALCSTVKEQLADYDHAYNSAAQILCEAGAEVPKSNPATKAMSAISTDMQNMMDPTSSKIAQMMIEGNTMGITTITKQLHEYKGGGEVGDLAKKQIRMEQKNIENLKKFL